MLDLHGCVLVVDDEEAVRASFTFLLEGYGLEVRGFASPTTFLAEVFPPGPVCVVLDLRLPELSGLEVLERLTTRPRQVPVILVTGHGNQQAADEARRLGAFDFLEKPFDDREFMERVEKALSSQIVAAPG